MRNSVLSIKQSDTDDIIRYLQDVSGEVAIAPELQEKLDRCNFCDDLIRKYGAMSKVVPMLMKQYKASLPIARAIYRDTTIIFNSNGKQQKDYWRNWQAEKLKRAFVLALREKDYKAVSMLSKELRLLLLLNEHEEDPIDYSKVELKQVIIGFFPELTGNVEIENLEYEIQKLTKPKRKNNIPAEDVDFTENDGAE